MYNILTEALTNSVEMNETNQNFMAKVQKWERYPYYEKFQFYVLRTRKRVRNSTKYLYIFELCVWEKIKHSVNLLNCKLFCTFMVIVFFSLLLVTVWRSMFFIHFSIRLSSFAFDKHVPNGKFIIDLNARHHCWFCEVVLFLFALCLSFHHHHFITHFVNTVDDSMTKSIFVIFVFS